MIRCLVVDDEPIAVRVLRAHLEKVPDVEVAAACTDSLAALSAVKNMAVDLVFLDIEMPGLSGIEFVESLVRPPRFVFTTAHRDYAVRGFELDAVDYLLKPISFPRLLRAVEKFRRLEGTESDASGSSGLPAAAINVRVDRRTVRIDVSDIVYVESLSDYVVFHTTTDRYTSKLRISDLEEQLDQYGIVRIHRSYLASLAGISSFTSSEVRIGSVTLPVSRTYRQRVMERLGNTGA